MPDSLAYESIYSRGAGAPAANPLAATKVQPGYAEPAPKMRPRGMYPQSSEPAKVYGGRYESPFSRPGSGSAPSAVNINKNSVGYGLQTGTQPAAPSSSVPEWQNSASPAYNSVQNQLLRFQAMRQPPQQTQAAQIPDQPMAQPAALPGAQQPAPSVGAHNDWVSYRPQPGRGAGISPQEMMQWIYQNQQNAQMGPYPAAQGRQLGAADPRMSGTAVGREWGDASSRSQGNAWERALGYSNPRRSW